MRNGTLLACLPFFWGANALAETFFYVGAHASAGGDQILTNPSDADFEPWGGLPGMKETRGLGVELGIRLGDRYRLELFGGVSSMRLAGGLGAGIDAPKTWPIAYLSDAMEIMPTALFTIGYGHRRQSLGHSDTHHDMVIVREGINLGLVARYEVKYSFVYARIAAVYELLLAGRQRLGDPHYTDDTFSFPGLSHRIVGQVSLGIAL